MRWPGCRVLVAGGDGGDDGGVVVVVGVGSGGRSGEYASKRRTDYNHQYHQADQNHDLLLQGEK